MYKTPTKRKRIVLTVEKKIEIIKRREKGESVTCLANEFGIGEQTARDIIKNRLKIEEFVSKSETFAGVSQRKSMKGATHEELDSILIKWYFEQRTLGVSISGPMILNQAKHLFKKLKFPRQILFSSGWLSRFKERHGIKDSKIKENQLSSLSTGVTSDELMKIIAEESLLPCQIYTSNETALYWRTMPTGALMSLQENNVSKYKGSNEKFAIFCCFNASGDDKLDLVIVGKSKSPRSLKDNESLPIIYFNNENASMCPDIFATWWKDKFVPHVKAFLSKNNRPHKALLVLRSSCYQSLLNFTTEDGDIKTICSIINVDKSKEQDVVEVLKKSYRTKLILDMIAKEQAPTLFFKSFTIRNAITNIWTAWMEITNETIEKYFKKVLPDYFPTTQVKVESIPNEDKNICEIVKTLKGCENVNQENINKWLYDAEHETKYETVERVLIPTEASVGSSREGQPCKISCEEALYAAETLLQFLKGQNDVDYCDVLQIQECVTKVKNKISAQMNTC